MLIDKNKYKELGIQLFKNMYVHEDELNICEPDDVDLIDKISQMSDVEPTIFFITKEQIKALLDGKLLYYKPSMSEFDNPFFLKIENNK